MTEVSIVMSVYNGEGQISKTLNSLFAQHDLVPEIVVVNDGSDDRTALILGELADSHANLKIIHQPNKGLTASLIEGCAVAKGEFIARQDCGDTSSPSRIARQLHALKSNPAASMVSCATDFLNEDGRLLYSCSVKDETTRDILIESPPHHGCVMFRKRDYLAVGGYRPEFYIAQDLDLWSRLQERGDHICLEEVLYTATVQPQSITSTRRHLQQRLAKLIHRAALRRKTGRSETPMLVEAKAISRKRPVGRRLGYSKHYFFVAGCLRATCPEEAKRQYFKAIQANPFHFKAWIRYLHILLQTR